MRIFIFALLQFFVFMPIASFAAGNVKPPETEKTQKTNITVAEKTAVQRAYGKLPLYFTENKGQVDKAVRFYERGAGHAAFFTYEGLTLTLTKSIDESEKEPFPIGKAIKENKDKKFTTEAVRLSFIGANKNAKVTSESPLPGHVNYFIGNDKTKWQSNVPTYKTVIYENIYNNIDIKFYGNNKNIEHDIIVSPGGNLKDVRFAYKGIKGLEITKKGDLRARLADGEIRIKKPIVYQVIKGKRKTIEGNYRILKGEDGSFTYGYDVASYDHTKELVIDPVLTYSTYLGGSLDDAASDITVDAAGNIYLTGNTWSIDFPTTTGYRTLAGTNDVFLTKIDATGSTMVYSSYLGGTSYDNSGAITVDDAGNVYITGSSMSSDFPLVYSTYLGGSSFDAGNGIALDRTGAAYIIGTTSSSDYPTVAAMQLSAGGWDSFITKINPAGSALVYSTYLGGTSIEDGKDIAVDASGAAYITGTTSSSDFPLVSPIQGYTGTGYDDVFISKINPAGTALVYSTCLGGSSVEDIFAIAIDASGNAYVTGSTWSTDFTVVNPLQGVYGGGYQDAFVTMVSADGQSFGYSTYLGGSDQESGLGIAVDTQGNTYVAGWTASLDFPLKSPIQATKSGKIRTNDAFISKIDGTPPPPVIMYIAPDTHNVTKGSTIGYNVTATNTTTTRQCFNYWENINLPGGAPYPATGELYGPIRLCLNAGASQTRHQTHGVPLSSPLGTYALNAFVGAYAFPVLPAIVDEAHFTFDVTAFNPLTQTPQTSWSLIE